MQKQHNSLTNPFLCAVLGLSWLTLPAETEIAQPGYAVSAAETFVDNRARGRSGHMGHALIDAGGGRILAFNSNVTTNRCNGHSGYGWMEYRISTDYGRTWGAPRVLDYSMRLYREGKHTALCEKGVRTPDGRILLFFQITDASRPICCEPWFEPTCVESRDGGETWSEARTACPERGRIYDAVVDRDSVYFLMPTSPNFGDTNQEYVVYKSTDAGPFVRHATTIEGSRKGYGAMEFAPDGSLVVYAYDSLDEDHPQYCISRDRAETWERPGRCTCDKLIRNPQVRRIGDDWFMCGRNGKSSPKPGHGDSLVLYHSKNGIDWSAGVTVSKRPDGTGTGFYSCLLPVFEPGCPPRLLLQYSRPYWAQSVNVEHRWIELNAPRQSAAKQDRGVLLLTFDDALFHDWDNALPLFDRYGAHATFFVNGTLDERKIAKMRAYQSRGHSVGLHGVRHIPAKPFVDKRGIGTWLEKEIEPATAALAKAHLAVRNYAYPNSSRTDETDDALRPHFDRIRTGHLFNRDPAKCPLATCDAAFVPREELVSSRLLRGMGFGSAFPGIADDFEKGLERLAARNEALVLYSHGIRAKPDGDKHNTSIDVLERILAKARALGIAVIGFDEIARTR